MTPPPSNETTSNNWVGIFLEQALWCKGTKSSNMQRAHDRHGTESSVWTAGHRNCWSGYKQYVFMAYRHDLAGSELNSAHREMH